MCCWCYYARESKNIIGRTLIYRLLMNAAVAPMTTPSMSESELFSSSSLNVLQTTANWPAMRLDEDVCGIKLLRGRCPRNDAIRSKWSQRESYRFDSTSNTHSRLVSSEYRSHQEPFVRKLELIEVNKSAFDLY